jgi:short-subunit dehydrogenase
MLLNSQAIARTDSSPVASRVALELVPQAAMPDVVVVTGASTGLGLALSKQLLATNHRLILTARASSLWRFADAGITENERVRIRPLDVTNGAERESVIEEANQTWGGVDILINNAGLAYRSVVEDLCPDDLREQMSVNFEAPLRLIRLVLPLMRKKRHGRIINISSVSGMLAMPTLALYSASKFALEGASESLWYELKPFGIHVTLVQPGFIRSESFRTTRFTPDSQRGMVDPRRAYHAHYRHMDGFIAKLMGLSPADPERVARVILKVLKRARPGLRVAATPDAHLFALLRRFLPRQLFHLFLYGRLPGVKDWGGTL